jgi:hypothetical protein
MRTSYSSAGETSIMPETHAIMLALAVMSASRSHLSPAQQQQQHRMHSVGSSSMGNDQTIHSTGSVPDCSSKSGAATQPTPSLGLFTGRCADGSFPNCQTKVCPSLHAFQDKQGI